MFKETVIHSLAKGIQKAIVSFNKLTFIRIALAASWRGCFLEGLPHPKRYLWLGPLKGVGQKPGKMNSRMTHLKKKKHLHDFWPSIGMFGLAGRWKNCGYFPTLVIFLGKNVGNVDIYNN